MGFQPLTCTGGCVPLKFLAYPEFIQDEFVNRLIGINTK